MKARIIYERSMHALTSSLAMCAQRIPFIKNFCPLLSSPMSLKVATPMTVSFVGIDSLSGQSITIVPANATFTNPADAQLNEDFRWLFKSSRFTMRSMVVDGLPDGLTSSLSGGFGAITGQPTETGTFSVSIIGWRDPNQGRQNTQTYTLTLNVAGPADPFADWQALFFDSDELLDPKITGPKADPDRDGLDNFLEFVLKLNPSEPNKMPGEFKVDPVDPEKFRYELPLNVEASGVSVFFEENSSLKEDDWKGVKDAEFTRTDTSIVLNAPRGSGKKLYRLRAVLAP